MHKILFLVSALLFESLTLTAQSPKVLKQVLELKMPKTVDDDMPGTRGASVVWHPVQKKYYASFAGNDVYPMAVFDEKGKRLSSDDLTTRIDTRGLWYNPNTKLVCGNAYSDLGWFTYTLDKNGIPTDANVEEEEMNQPDLQSVGVYNTASKQVLFLHGSHVYVYNDDAELIDSILIRWGKKKGGDTEEHDGILEPEESYNASLIYTGIKGQELGLLHLFSKQIELYDIKTGYLTKSLSLPESATIETIFNFAYANGTYWLFNIEERKWVGYK